MTQDLLSVVANRMRQDDDPWGPSAVHQGLRECFERQSFRSVRDGKLYAECPFSKALMRVMSLSFIKDDSGALRPLENQRPGSLLIWVRNRMNGVENQSEQNLIPRGVKNG